MRKEEEKEKKGRKVKAMGGEGRERTPPKYISDYGPLCSARMCVCVPIHRQTEKYRGILLYGTDKDT